jgi:DNA-binding PadR family transcriptional regulator
MKTLDKEIPSALEGGKELTALELEALTEGWSGSIYPALARLEKSGHVKSRWQDGFYPRRRLYSLSADRDAWPLRARPR